MWKKIENIIANEEWFRFDTGSALCRVWYVGRGKGDDDDSIVVQATMEMYAPPGGKVVRPTLQLIGSGTEAWEAYRAGEAYRVIRTIVKTPTSDDLQDLIGTDFRQERIYLSGVVLLGNIEVQGDARLALCATGRAGLGFAVGPATPQPRAATKEQEAALAVAATLPSHEL
jgi:hypothetical protein